MSLFFLPTKNCSLLKHFQVVDVAVAVVGKRETLYKRCHSHWIEQQFEKRSLVIVSPSFFLLVFLSFWLCRPSRSLARFFSHRHLSSLLVLPSFRLSTRADTTVRSRSSFRRACGEMRQRVGVFNKKRRLSDEREMNNSVIDTPAACSKASSLFSPIFFILKWKVCLILMPLTRRLVSVA